jgi:hypothetical protein
MPATETLISIALGIGLSAACGFRVFIPLLIMSIAALTGHLTLASGFEWIGTVPALIAFGTATVFEVSAYCIPWLDHLLDTFATPIAVAAGAIVSASVITDLAPLLKWILALIGGGGAAGTIQGTTVLLRMKSTALTGGLGNFPLAAGEMVGAVVTALLALIVPLITMAVIAAVLIFTVRAAGGLLFGKKRTG